MLRRCCLAGFGLHFLAVLLVPCGETLLLVGHGSTLLTNGRTHAARAVEANFVRSSGQVLRSVRAKALIYLHLAGIETGYGFFAPNLPASCRLQFEAQYPDGRVEPDAIAYGSRESRLRGLTLLDYLARTASDHIREVILKLLAYSVWQQHPAATGMRVDLESLEQPSAADFVTGKRATYELLYSYDFAWTDPPTARSER